MTDKVKKILLFTSIGVLSLGVIGTGVGITEALYFQKKDVNQNIGYQGPLATYSFFLDTNTDWEANSAIFYVYAFNSADATQNIWLTNEATLSEKQINGSGSYTLHVFRIDTSKYNRFNFVRFNPNGLSVPSWNRDDNSLWDQTSMQVYTANVNYYKVDTNQRVENGDGYGHKTAKVIQTGTLSESNSALVLSNTTNY